MHDSSLANEILSKATIIIKTITQAQNKALKSNSMSKIRIKQIFIHQYEALCRVTNMYKALMDDHNELLLKYKILQQQLNDEE